MNVGERLEERYKLDINFFLEIVNEGLCSLIYICVCRWMSMTWKNVANWRLWSVLLPSRNEHNSDKEWDKPEKRSNEQTRRSPFILLKIHLYNEWLREFKNASYKYSWAISLKYIVHYLLISSWLLALDASPLEHLSSLYPWSPSGVFPPLIFRSSPSTCSFYSQNYLLLLLSIPH